MTETLDNFYNRIYIAAKHKHVLIYPSPKSKNNFEGRCEIWSIEKTKQYITWLKNNPPMKLTL